MNINNHIFPVVYNPHILNSEMVTKNFCSFYKNMLGFGDADETKLFSECVEPISVYIESLKNAAIAARS